MDTIIRTYPIKKVYNLSRYSSDDFVKYKSIILDNYKKWLLGINFKTNRKLKIGGTTHKTFGYDNFYIKLFSYPYNHYDFTYILFTELDGINSELYLKETSDIKQQLDNYNMQIINIIQKVNLLEKWEDFIEFDNTKYGIPEVYNNIHKKNNCSGQIIEDYYKPCLCLHCTSWNGCSYNGTQYYKCNKCNYKYIKNEEGIYVSINSSCYKAMVKKYNIQ